LLLLLGMLLLLALALLDLAIWTAALLAQDLSDHWTMLMVISL
jgi:hypothetical protein